MYTILIVEDEPMMCKGLKTILEKSDLLIKDIVEAGNGEEAVDYMYKQCPDIVITDIRMPRMDGLELSKKIKESYPYVAVIIVSGYDDFSYAQQALKFGVKDYILKPYSKESIVESVDKIIQQTKRVDLTLYISYNDFEILANMLYEGIWIKDTKAMDTVVEKLYPQIKGYPNNIVNVILSELFKIVVEKVSKSTGHALEFSMSDANAADLQQFRLWFNTAVKDIFNKLNIIRTTADQNYIEIARKHLEENYWKDISLEEIAGITGFHPTYFSQMFKTDTGKTFVQYKSELRMKKAMELLCWPDKSVTYVALEVGFNDVAHFIKTFKKYTGMTPTKFRQERGIEK